VKKARDENPKTTWASDLQQRFGKSSLGVAGIEQARIHAQDASNACRNNDGDRRVEIGIEHGQALP
jgi:hypothetical protein